MTGELPDSAARALPSRRPAHRGRAARPAAPPGLSVEKFSAIVGAVYECVLDPTGWPAAIERMREAVDGPTAWIAVHHPHQVRSVYEIEVGTDPEWQRRLRETYVPMSPFISVPHHATPGLVVSVADVVDYGEFADGRFYKEWAGPQGLTDFIMAVLTAEPDRMTWLGFGLNRRARPYDKARAAAFRPHVERALRISDLLEARTAQAADLAAALESLPAGTVLVDADRRVRGINPAAERLIRDGAGPALRQGRLYCPGGTDAELRAAISACAEQRLDCAGATFLIDGADGGIGLVVHVLPLTRPRAAAAGEAVAAVFLTPPAAPVRAPMRAFVRRFGLTPAETRVLIALVEGKSPGAIAAAQGASLATVRTHLRRLYDKTETGGQVEVIRLLNSLGVAL